MNRSCFFLLWRDKKKRRKPIFFPRINFPRTINTFREDFRIESKVAEIVLNGISIRIQNDITKYQVLTPQQQLLITLHFLGTNAQYHAVGAMHGVHKSTICNCIHNVIKAIIDVFFRRVVKWPLKS